MKTFHKLKQKAPVLRFRTVLAPVLLLFPAILTGCAKNIEPVSRTGFYFDTVIQITLYDTADGTILDGCFELAEKYENLFSATKEGSDVWNINHGNGETVIVSEETTALLVTAADFANTTEGAIDPTILPVSELWNFGSEGEAHVPDNAAVKEALSHVSYDNILFGTAPSDETGEYGLPNRYSV